MPTISGLLKAIQHPIRRSIMDQLNETTSPIPYSELLHIVEDSTGKLNYHLKIMADIVEKRDTGYTLSDKGRKIVSLIQKIILESDENIIEKPSIVISKLRPMKSLKSKFIMEYTLFIFFMTVMISLIVSLLLERIWTHWIFLLIEFIGIYIIILYCNSIWYNISDTEVEVFKGIITHTHKIVPYRTIVNMELKFGLFDRIFEMGSIEIHTAGSGLPVPEEKIIGMVNPDEIKETILERIRTLNPPEFLIQGGKSPHDPRFSLIVNELKKLNEELDGTSFT